MTNCCPRPPMQWSGAIGVIARCKRASTVCAPKSRSRRALRSICGEKPKAKGVTRPFKPYIRRVQDESNPVSSLQSPRFNDARLTRVWEGKRGKQGEKWQKRANGAMAVG